MSGGWGRARLGSLGPAGSAALQPCLAVEDSGWEREAAAPHSLPPPKYLGHAEVEESRGMHVCEEAVKKLKAVSGRWGGGGGRGGGWPG